VDAVAGTTLGDGVGCELEAIGDLGDPARARDDVRRRRWKYIGPQLERRRVAWTT